MSTEPQTETEETALAEALFRVATGFRLKDQPDGTLAWAKENQQEWARWTGKAAGAILTEFHRLDATRAAQDWLNGADVPHVDTALATLDVARAAQDVAGRESAHMKRYGLHDCKGGVEGDLFPLDAQPVTPPPGALREALTPYAGSDYDLVADEDHRAVWDAVQTYLALHAQGVAPTEEERHDEA